MLNYFKELYDSWLDFDCNVMGYYSDAYLDRIARISPSMSEIEKENEYERAIDEIIKYDFRNIYTKKYVDQPLAEIEDDENETIDEILSQYTWGVSAEKAPPPPIAGVFKNSPGGFFWGQIIF